MPWDIGQTKRKFRLVEDLIGRLDESDVDTTPRHRLSIRFRLNPYLHRPA